MGEELRDFAEKESKPALWILLLRRVSDMTIDPREEVRTGMRLSDLTFFQSPSVHIHIHINKFLSMLSLNIARKFLDIGHKSRQSISK